jgi:hypothetical protein
LHSKDPIAPGLSVAMKLRNAIRAVRIDHEGCQVSAAHNQSKMEQNIRQHQSKEGEYIIEIK